MSGQTLFTLVSWPFSLKMLWAPLVDSCYIKAFGRRKSWLVPTQLLIARERGPGGSLEFQLFPCCVLPSNRANL